MNRILFEMPDIKTTILLNKNSGKFLLKKVTTSWISWNDIGTTVTNNYGQTYWYMGEL